MQPAAHIAATIDVLETYFTSQCSSHGIPADALLNRYFRQRRYIGSRDRTAIATRFYHILKHRLALTWWTERANTQETARTLTIVSLRFHDAMDFSQIQGLFSGKDYAPCPLTTAEQQLVAACTEHQELVHDEMPKHIAMNVPEWLFNKLAATYGETLQPLLATLLEEASVDIRVNTLKATKKDVLSMLQQSGIAATTISHTPTSIRLDNRAPLSHLETFRKGWFEIQDAGSQIAAGFVQAAPGDMVIDFCAGAGGKTLSIAAQMQNKGRILAWDVHERRLKDLPKRLKRAGVHNVSWRVIQSESDPWIKRHKHKADWVLTDVPCSGSGTWRRNPDLKWRMTQEGLTELMALQQRILNSAARLVKPGGRLVYVTCSLLPEENEQQIAQFLRTHSDYEIEPVGAGCPFQTLLPHQEDCDGFFIATLRRKPQQDS